MIHAHKKHYAWTTKSGKKFGEKDSWSKKNSAVANAELCIRVSVQLKEKKKRSKETKGTKRIRDGDKENGEQWRKRDDGRMQCCVCALLYRPHAHAYTPSLSHSLKKNRVKKNENTFSTG